MEMNNRADSLQELGLPSLEEKQENRQQPAAQRYHFLVETPDGEGMSLNGDEIPAYLKSTASAADPKKTGN